MKKVWIIRMVLVVTAALIVMTAAVMWLWNMLIPALFSGPVITFWQAAGLLILTRILFKGFSGMRGRSYRSCGRWKDKWETMTPEQKEKVRELWRKRCGTFGTNAEVRGEQ